MSCSQKVRPGSRAVYSGTFKILSGIFAGPGRSASVQGGNCRELPLESGGDLLRAPPRPTKNPVDLEFEIDVAAFARLPLVIKCGWEKMRAQHRCRARRREEVITGFRPAGRGFSMSTQGSRQVEEFHLVQIGYHPVRRLGAVPVEDLITLRVLFSDGVVG